MGHKKNFFTSGSGGGIRKSARSSLGWHDLILVIALSLWQVISVMNGR